MTRPASNARSAATRRGLLGAGAGFAVAGWLAGRPARAGAAAAEPAATTAALADVLERPAAAVRDAAAAPVLRVARCGRRLVAVGERGVVLLSDDDGQRWQQARVPVSVTLTGVQFTSERRGFAIGHGGVVLRSDDAGQSWRRLLDGRQIPALLDSVDAARQAAADGPDKPWLALHFSDDLNGLVVGAFGLALETADGGQSWRSFADRLANPRSLHLYAVHRQGGSVWVAGEQGLYALSVDGGRRFSVLPTPYRGSFFALCPQRDGSVLLGGLRGTLLLHAGGGDSFRAIAAASNAGVAQLLALPPQGLALVDQAGRIFTAAVFDSGVADLRFKPLPVTPGRAWLSVAQAADGALVGASFSGLSRLQPSLSPPKT